MQVFTQKAPLATTPLFLYEGTANSRSRDSFFFLQRLLQIARGVDGPIMSLDGCSRWRRAGSVCCAFLGASCCGWLKILVLEAHSKLLFWLEFGLHR